MREFTWPIFSIFVLLIVYDENQFYWKYAAAVALVAFVCFCGEFKLVGISVSCTFMCYIPA